MKNLTSLGLCIVLASAASCAERERSPSPPCDCPSGARPAATAVLAWLSQARSLHHLADGFEDDGLLDRAKGSLTELVQAPRPAGGAPEIDEILADTYARLAEIQSRKGSFSEALANVECGLVFAREEGYFRGHLFEVQGLVFERQSRELAKEGNVAESDRARAQAVRASAAAVRIQGGVIGRTLPDAASPNVRDR